MPLFCAKPKINLLACLCFSALGRSTISLIEVGMAWKGHSFHMIPIFRCPDHSVKCERLSACLPVVEMSMQVMLLGRSVSKQPFFKNPGSLPCFHIINALWDLEESDDHDWFFTATRKKWTDMYSKDEQGIPKENIKIFYFRLRGGWVSAKQF